MGTDGEHEDEDIQDFIPSYPAAGEENSEGTGRKLERTRRQKIEVT